MRTSARKFSYFTENICSSRNFLSFFIGGVARWHTVLRNSCLTKRRTSSNVLRYFLYNYEYILYIKILSNGNVNFVYKYLLHTFILYCATIPGYWALHLSLKNEKLNRFFYLFVSQDF